MEEDDGSDGGAVADEDWMDEEVKPKHWQLHTYTHTHTAYFKVAYFFHFRVQERKPATRNSRKRKTTEPKADKAAKSPTKQSNKKRRIIKDDNDDADQLPAADDDDGDADGSNKNHKASVSLARWRYSQRYV